MKNFVIAATFVLVAFGVSISAPAPKKREGTYYYPLIEKTAWVWEEMIGTQTLETKVSVTNVERKDRDWVVTIHTDSGGTAKFLVSASGVSELCEGAMTYDPPIPLLKLPHKLDSTWEFKTRYNRDLKKEKFGTLKGTMASHGPEEINVPAGKFHCIRIEWNYEAYIPHDSRGICLELPTGVK